MWGIATFLGRVFVDPEKTKAKQSK
jgi:hypothetical protein